MVSFAKLLRRMRGQVSIAELAEKAGVYPEALAKVEAGRLSPDEGMVRLILGRGLGLPREDVDRTGLGLRLYDLGLRDNDIRQLVIDVLQRRIPDAARAELKRLYRGYAGRG
jgi:transcriptional regulator with XRE-family HTH domain